MRIIKEKLTKEQARFRKEARNQTITMIITSLGLVAGLAWNEAIKSTIEFFFPTTGGMIAKFIFALILTGIVVTVSYVLTRLKRTDEEVGGGE